MNWSELTHTQKFDLVIAALHWHAGKGGAINDGRTYESPAHWYDDAGKLRASRANDLFANLRAFNPLDSHDDCVAIMHRVREWGMERRYVQALIFVLVECTDEDARLPADWTDFRLISATPDQKCHAFVSATSSVLRED